MRIAGSHVVNAPREEVWRALQDPSVLAQTLPGCQQLEVLGPDRYGATLNAGVASIKGTYKGEVELLGKVEPASYTMRASGAGGPGTIQADAAVTLHDDGPCTRIEYEADAVIGGMIGGVGQRMLVGVAQRTAGEFFAAVERALVEGPGAPAAEEEPPALPTATGAAPAGQVFAGRAPAGPGDATKYLIGALVGAALVLLGVLVGRRTR